MKKTIIIVAFMLIGTTVFAQSNLPYPLGPSGKITGEAYIEGMGILEYGLFNVPVGGTEDFYIYMTFLIIPGLENDGLPELGGRYVIDANSMIRYADNTGLSINVKRLMARYECNGSTTHYSNPDGSTRFVFNFHNTNGKYETWVFNAYSVAVDLADILQDLAIQTACLGRYSTAQTGVYVTSRYDDPPDWYDPPMMANRFARMSGNMTRIETFYGVCFDYAQFAWNDIKRYQKWYNDAGMKGQQWYIALANKGNPNIIILYDPLPEGRRNEATIISNGIYLKENSRHRVYAHDGATGHAWLWVQHNNGTWYWIDPTWTDNTGYPWWGMIQNGKEIQYYPDPEYCVASNYPRPGATNNETRSSNSTYTGNASTPSYNYSNSYFWGGYNYANGLPLGITIGFFGIYTSWNLALPTTDDITEGRFIDWAFTAGYSFELIDSILRLPVGIGMSRSYEYLYYFDKYDGYVLYYDEFIAEAGLQLILIEKFYLSAAYRLIGFSRSGFTIGAGFVF